MKPWYVSRTIWLGIAFGVLSGFVAAINEIEAGGVEIPAWLVSLASLCAAVIIPALRTVTRTEVQNGYRGVIAAVIAAIVAFTGAMVGLPTPSLTNDSVTQQVTGVSHDAIDLQWDDAIGEPGGGDE